MSVGTGPLSPETTKDSGSPLHCLPTGRGLQHSQEARTPKSTRDHVKSRHRGREAREALSGCRDAQHTRQEHRTELRLPLSSVRAFLHLLNRCRTRRERGRTGRACKPHSGPSVPFLSPVWGETLNTNLSPSVTESGMNGYGLWSLSGGGDSPAARG